MQPGERAGSSNSRQAGGRAGGRASRGTAAGCRAGRARRVQHRGGCWSSRQRLMDGCDVHLVCATWGHGLHSPSQMESGCSPVSGPLAPPACFGASATIRPNPRSLEPCDQRQKSRALFHPRPLSVSGSSYRASAYGVHGCPHVVVFSGATIDAVAHPNYQNSPAPSHTNTHHSSERARASSPTTARSHAVPLQTTAPCVGGSIVFVSVISCSPMSPGLRLVSHSI
jgi:hypothetical protein